MNKSEKEKYEAKI